MSGYLDLDTWPRREQFAFFRTYEQPHFGLTAEVEVTALRRACRAEGASFSLACWFAVQRAVNAVEALRYRLRGDRVWVHDRLRVATTVDTGPETFAFVHLPFGEGFADFVAAAKAAIADARARPEAPMDHRADDDAVVYGTVVPWLRFTAIQHARRLDETECVPRIALGKACHDGRPGAEGPIRMPVSISAHHALVDGVHVGRFYKTLQATLDAPGWLNA